MGEFGNLFAFFQQAESYGTAAAVRVKTYCFKDCRLADTVLPGEEGDAAKARDRELVDPPKPFDAQIRKVKRGAHIRS